MNDEVENVTEAPQPTLPEALKEVDPDKMKKILETVQKFKERKEKTVSGSEAVDEGPQPEQGDVMDGSKVDWSEYELRYELRHLYPRAKHQMTPEGPKWVAMVEEFHSAERAYGSYGQKVNTPNRQDKEPLNFGEYLNDMLNSPEGWRIASMLPTSMGRVGLLLHRMVPVVLPNPTLLEKETEVEAPTDPELAQMEDTALKFMETEGLTPPAPVEETEGGEQE